MADDDAPQPDAPEPDAPEPDAPEPEKSPSGASHAPEHGAKRRRRWLLVAVPLAVLVIVVTGVLGLQRARLWLGPQRGLVVAPGSTAVLPSHVPGEQPGFALGGSGDAILYLQSSSAIQRVDLGSGDATVTATPELPPVSNLVAGPGWVLSKTVGASSGVLVPDGSNAQLPPVAVQQAGRAYPGSGGIWVLPEQASEGGRTAVLIDVNGVRIGDTSIQVPESLGIPVGHLTNTLISAGAKGTFNATPEGSRRLSPGTLLAVGTDAVLSWGCSVKGSCDARIDSPGQATAYKPAARVSFQGLYNKNVASALGFRGALSPDRRWVALELPKPTRSGARLVLVDLQSGHRVEIPGALAIQNGSDQAAWTPNSRYLLAVTGGRLRAFDSTSGKVVTFGGTLVDLQHLTIAGTATM